MNRSGDRQRRVERLCSRDDLATYDPYDVWKTALGFRAKDLFNRHRWLGMLPAGALTLFDTYVNNERRWFYRRQEYPVVRALAALALLNLHARSGEERLLAPVRRHLDWLEAHASSGYSGPCWGIGFRQPISAGLHYEADLPLATMTPYVLDAFVRYHEATGEAGVVPVIRGIHAFFDCDLVVMEETDRYMVTSYSPLPDRRVVNAVGYAMFAFARALPYVDEAAHAGSLEKIRKLYGYLRHAQRADGSWLYSPDGPPFIDCFHSCFVLKHLERTRRITGLPGAEEVIRRGYGYLLQHFRDPDAGLFRRFALENKPSLARFDLYDNAEMIHLANLLGDAALARELADAVERHFCRGDVVYSQIDRFGLRHNPDTLRWAVMPWLHALSTLD